MRRPPAPRPADDAAVRRQIRAAYRRLRRHNGPLGWWPGKTPFEIAAGAILTQNTAWTNVEKAIAALREAGLLSAGGIRSAPASRIAALIRPSGYFRQKTRKLKSFVRFLDEGYAGSLRAMAAAPTDRLREELLGVWGIGPETADSILLYACGHRVFVVDAYTRRIAARHGWVHPRATYDQLQDLFVRCCPPDTSLYNDFHAHLVWVGKHHCRTTPRCETCPLRSLLPEAARPPG